MNWKSEICRSQNDIECIDTTCSHCFFDGFFEVVDKYPSRLLRIVLGVPFATILWKEVDVTKQSTVMGNDDKYIVGGVESLDFADTPLRLVGVVAETVCDFVKGLRCAVFWMDFLQHRTGAPAAEIRQ